MTTTNSIFFQTELSRKFTKAILGEFHERIHQVKMLVNSPLRTFAKVHKRTSFVKKSFRDKVCPKPIRFIDNNPQGVTQSLIVFEAMQMCTCIQKMNKLLFTSILLCFSVSNCGSIDCDTVKAFYQTVTTIGDNNETNIGCCAGGGTLDVDSCVASKDDIPDISGLVEASDLPDVSTGSLTFGPGDYVTVAPPDTAYAFVIVVEMTVLDPTATLDDTSKLMLSKLAEFGTANMPGGSIAWNINPDDKGAIEVIRVRSKADHAEFGKTYLSQVFGAATAAAGVTNPFTDTVLMRSIGITILAADRSDIKAHLQSTASIVPFAELSAADQAITLSFNQDPNVTNEQYIAARDSMSWEQNTGASLGFGQPVPYTYLQAVEGLATAASLTAVTADRLSVEHMLGAMKAVNANSAKHEDLVYFLQFIKFNSALTAEAVEIRKALAAAWGSTSNVDTRLIIQEGDTTGIFVTVGTVANIKAMGLQDGNSILPRAAALTTTPYSVADIQAHTAIPELSYVTKATHRTFNSDVAPDHATLLAMVHPTSTELLAVPNGGGLQSLALTAFNIAKAGNLDATAALALAAMGADDYSDPVVTAALVGAFVAAFAPIYDGMTLDQLEIASGYEVSHQVVAPLNLVVDPIHETIANLTARIEALESATNTEGRGLNVKLYTFNRLIDDLDNENPSGYADYKAIANATVGDTITVPYKNISVTVTEQLQKAARDIPVYGANWWGLLTRDGEDPVFHKYEDPVWFVKGEGLGPWSDDPSIRSVAVVMSKSTVRKMEKSYLSYDYRELRPYFESKYEPGYVYGDLIIESSKAFKGEYTNVFIGEPMMQILIINFKVDNNDLYSAWRTQIGEDNVVFDTNLDEEGLQWSGNVYTLTHSRILGINFESKDAATTFWNQHVSSLMSAVTVYFAYV